MWKRCGLLIGCAQNLNSKTAYSNVNSEIQTKAWRLVAHLWADTHTTTTCTPQMHTCQHANLLTGWLANCYNAILQRTSSTGSTQQQHTAKHNRTHASIGIYSKCKKGEAVQLTLGQCLAKHDEVVAPGGSQTHLTRKSYK